MRDSFADEITSWIDPDGLIGTCPHPLKWSGGNQILETAITFHYLRNLANPRTELFLKLYNGINACQAPNGSFYKNPGRFDQITHDDLMAVATIGPMLAQLLCQCGQKQKYWGLWNLSNDGSVYWDALVKPWQKAFYILATGDQPSPSQIDFYSTSILIGTTGLRLGLKNPSTDRLSWLTLNAVKERSSHIEAAHQSWALAMKQAYGSVGQLMRAYYNYDSHPFVIWGDRLAF